LLLYLIDNDIIIELASYKLLGETMASFNLTYKDKAVRILPSASSYINSNSELRKKYKLETLQLAKSRADNYEKINKSLIDQKEDSEYESLIAIENIDPGEALLVAATEYETDFYILTCDKKFLKALSRSNLTRVSASQTLLTRGFIRYVGGCSSDTTQGKLIYNPSSRCI
jgi:hypothetical protein